MMEECVKVWLTMEAVGCNHSTHRREDPPSRVSIKDRRVFVLIKSS